MHEEAHSQVADDELDFDEELQWTYRGRPFTGISYEDSEVGRVEIGFVDGVQSGPARALALNGRVVWTGAYRGGARHGMFMEYDSEGSPLLVEEYELGVLMKRERFLSGDPISREEIDFEGPEYKVLEKFRGWDNA
jgi:hypothetical protein